MVGPPPQVVLPVAGAPKLIAERFLSRGTEGCVGVWLTLEIHIPELCEVTAHRLIAIDVDYLGDVKREEHVKKKDFVAPDDALL